MLKVEDARTVEELVKTFEEDERASFLLYESGSLKKPLRSCDFTDKATIISELKDSLLYGSWPPILQIKQGLRNLGVLDIVVNNPDIMKPFFCCEPPDLSPGIYTQ